MKKVDKEPGACYDADEFFRLTRPRYPDTVIGEGQVLGYDNEMVIRYLDKVVVNDDTYEVRLKGGVSVTDAMNSEPRRGKSWLSVDVRERVTPRLMLLQLPLETIK